MGSLKENFDFFLIAAFKAGCLGDKNCNVLSISSEFLIYQVAFYSAVAEPILFPKLRIEEELDAVCYN